MNEHWQLCLNYLNTAKVSMLYLVHLWRILETVTYYDSTFAQMQCPEIFIFPFLMVSGDIQNKKFLFFSFFFVDRCRSEWQKAS